MGEASPGAPGHLEREVKLGAWPGFVLPDLDGVLPWVRVRPAGESTLDALYLDTPDLRLARWGITVRHRSGEGDDRWTVKLPADLGGEGGEVLHRVEHEQPGTRDELPPVLAGLLRAFVRSTTLVPAAHLSTLRRSWRLLDAGDRPVGVVDDDEVSVLDDGRVAARFREVEAEILPGVSPALIDALVARLRQAGAGAPDPTPKLVRALGPRALAPPEVVPLALPPEPSVGQLVQRSIASSVLRILVHDPGVRLDAGVEAVHQARVGTRRLRSDLRTFAPVLAEGWADPLRGELKWLGAVLGEVRDADVLGERLRGAVDALPTGDRTEARPLLVRLEVERATALGAAREALDSPRYTTLLDDLVAAAADPRLGPDAARPAAEVLPDLVRRPWRKLAKEVHDLDQDPPDEALHAVRIRAKRARYAAEAAAEAVPAAARHAKAIARLQGILGDHHDAVVAEGWLRAAAVEAPPATALVAGLLVAAEQAEAGAHRGGWPDAWERASDRKRTRWL